MRAILVDPGAPGHLKTADAPDPVPLSSQALVQVKAISLNLGEVRRARRGEPGAHLGDVDQKRAAGCFKRHPNAAKYTDFRKLLDGAGGAPTTDLLPAFR